MRIENSLSALYAQNPATQRNTFGEPAASSGPAAKSVPIQQSQNPPNQRQPNKNVPGIVVDISPEGWAAYNRGKSGITQKMSPANNPTECKTCSSRTYKDISNDPSVSFQSPTHISPGQSAAIVASHESEHVSNEQAKAERDGREIISQTVTLRTSICPECKRIYISGGTTYTISTDAAPALGT